MGYVFPFVMAGVRKRKGYGRRSICAVIDGGTLEDFIIFYNIYSCLYTLDIVVSDEARKSEFPHSFQSRAIEAVLLLHCV